MSIDAAFEKFNWLDQFSEFIDRGGFSLKPLKSFPIATQMLLITNLIQTLGMYFGEEHFFGRIEPSDPEYELKYTKIMERILNPWINGLSNTPIAQIVNTLHDIVCLKTEYKKWPPKSVMEFLSECKRYKPSFHDAYVAKPSDLIQITYDIGSAEQRNMNLMKEFVAKFKMSGKKKNHESCDFSEEYDKLCEQRNLNQVCECGTSYYIDKACPECGNRNRSYKPPEEPKNKTQWGGY